MDKISPLQCLLIQNLLESLKKVHSRCALLILGNKLKTLKIYMLHSLEIRSFMAVRTWQPTFMTMDKKIASI
ncbi:uncharacterized protein LOC143244053 isoform X2 [Tachypleus tridentatus]|uniref:uncharacterized protein LOC143244053 isoform X2 n=1 Tax=Tachypleus tridentatus TaxID=6853 RepID=UPI003FD2724C